MDWTLLKSASSRKGSNVPSSENVIRRFLFFLEMRYVVFKKCTWFRAQVTAVSLAHAHYFTQSMLHLLYVHCKCSTTKCLLLQRGKAIALVTMVPLVWGCRDTSKENEVGTVSVFAFWRCTSHINVAQENLLADSKTTDGTPCRVASILCGSTVWLLICCLFSWTSIQEFSA